VVDILRLSRTYRSLTRLRQILQVLAKYGFGYLVHRVQLGQYLPLPSRWKQPRPEEVEEVPLARRFADMLQDLGPTFIKFGQMLANRPDLLPPEFIQELRRLQDQVVPFDTALARTSIEQELGAPLDTLFPEFEPEPFAAGSIAQVYRARTAEGTPVVVKVKRPGIERVILTDIDLLTHLARLLEEHVAEARVLRPELIVEEFGRTIRRELDFLTEAAATAQFGKQFAEERRVRIPEVFWEYTTSSVLTLELLSGHNVADGEALARMGVDRRALARTLADVFLQQFFVTGLFHGDPHGGNLLADEAGVLALVDFGMVGHLTEELRTHLATVLIAAVTRQLDIMIQTFTDIGVLGPETDMGELKSDLNDLLNKYFEIPFARIDQVRVFQELMALARQHHVFLPREFVLLGKAFVTVSGLAKELDPQFDLATIAGPYARRLVLERLSPGRLTRSLGVLLWQLVNLAQRAPRELRELLDKAVAGQLQVIFRHQGLDPFGHTLERTGNRLASSVTLAAVLLSATMLITAGLGPKLFGVSALGLAGFAVAGMLAVWLGLAIWRSNR
jgi:ubiquinone biosynthesis protein